MTRRDEHDISHNRNCAAGNHIDASLFRTVRNPAGGEDGEEAAHIRGHLHHKHTLISKRLCRERHLKNRVWRDFVVQTYSKQLRHHPTIPQTLDNRRQEQTEAVNRRDDKEEDEREHLDVDVQEGDFDPMPVEFLRVHGAFFRSALAVVLHAADGGVAFFGGEEFGFGGGVGEEEASDDAEDGGDGAL